MTPTFEEQVEARLGVKFKNRQTLREAFVHRSYMNEFPAEGQESNERLEFFGDAVLSYVVAERLFRDCPECDEGDLTEWRGYLVRRDSLAAFARRLGLGDFLLLGRGEETAGGRERAQNLASLFEAVVGAIAIDRGLRVSRKFIFDALGDELNLKGRPTPVDPKSKLQEVVQARWQRAPTYRTVHEEGPDTGRSSPSRPRSRARCWAVGPVTASKRRNARPPRSRWQRTPSRMKKPKPRWTP